jgi:hypothetical protein
MILGLYAVPASILTQILDDPRTVAQVLAPDDAEALESGVAHASQMPGCLGWFLPFLRRTAGSAPSTPVPKLDLDPASVRSIDLDKAWHGIHFLLNGTADQGTPPLDFMVEGGLDVGSEHWGYCSPRAFQPEEVQAIASALEPLTEDQLRSRFDPEKMINLGIYPSIWDRNPEEDDTLSYCIEYFREMREFVADTARRGDGLVVTLE